MRKAFLCLILVLCLNAAGFAEFVVGAGLTYDFSSNTMATGGADSTTSLHSLGFNLYEFYGGSIGLVVQFSMPIPVVGSSQSGSTIMTLDMNSYSMKYVIDLLICGGFPITLSDTMMLIPSFGIHVGQLLLVGPTSTIDMSMGPGVMIDFFNYFTQNLGVRFGLSGAYDFFAIAAPSNVSYRGGFYISAVVDFVIKLSI